MSTTGEQTRMGERKQGNLDFGTEAPPLSEQLAGLGIVLSEPDAEQLQADADAITRLSARGLLTREQGDSARKHMVQALQIIPTGGGGRCVSDRP